MKKRHIPIFFLFLTLVILIPFVSAQTYSGFNKFTDNIKLFFSSGENKVKLALEIREKEINAAIENAKEGNNEDTIKNLEAAKDKLKIVQEGVSPDIAIEVRSSVKEVQDNINENKDVNTKTSQYFEDYLAEEEKTNLSVELSEKVFNYCKELAIQDYSLMEKDEKCKSYSWMQKAIGENIEAEKNKDVEEIKNQMSICMSNPKECNCEKVSLYSEKANCEKYKALAIKCEFQDDGSACEQLGNIKGIGEVEADREQYEKEIIEKYLPAECSEAGVRDGEECKRLILTLNQPKSECLENGEYIGDEKCREKLVDSGNVVKECVVDGNLVDPKECLNIIKEENKPTGKEWELMSGECKELGVYDPLACDEIVNLPRPCKDAGHYTKSECETFTLKNNLPKECMDAGALTPESCEKLKLPSDCQGEAYTREECETIKIEQKFPEECKNAGELDPEKCAVIMVGKESLVVTPGAEMEYLIRQGLTFEQIPSVCMNGMNFIRSDSCDAELAKLGITLPKPTATAGIAKECMVDNRVVVSPEECQNKIEQKIVIDAIPKECRDAEITNPEYCSNFISQQRQEQGIGINMPEECFGKSAEECKLIMEEKGIKVEKIEQVQRVEKAEKIQKMCKEGEECEKQPVEYEEIETPSECIELGISAVSDCKMVMGGINEERIKQGDKIIVDEKGNTDYITGEQINKIVKDSEINSQDIKPDISQAQEMKQEIQEVENGIRQIDEGGISQADDSNKEISEGNEPATRKDDNILTNEEGEGGENIIVSSGDNQDSVNGESSESDSGESNGGEGSGSEESSITGGAVVVGNKNSFFEKIIKAIFG